MSIYSTALKRADASSTLLDRFEEHRSDPDNNGCWNWVGDKTTSGYGRIHYGYFSGRARQVAAHRASWVLFRGDLASSELVLHKCDNRKCVNPDHLFVGSPAENVYDMCIKDRHFGADWRARKAGEVERVKDLARMGVMYKDIAKHLGISKTSVSFIMSGRYRYARLLSGEFL